MKSDSIKNIKILDTWYEFCNTFLYRILYTNINSNISIVYYDNSNTINDTKKLFEKSFSKKERSIRNVSIH